MTTPSKYFILNDNQKAPNNGNGYTPSDIRQAYNIPSGLDGNGQQIGILEFSSGYSTSDARQFWSNHNITPPNVEFVGVDGAHNDGGTSRADEEASLDLQWAGAIAPGADIIVYEINPGQTMNDFAKAMTRALKYVLNDNQHNPSVLSISYGDAEASFNSSAIQEWESLIGQLSQQGVTVCVSSGDQGAYGMHNPNGPRKRHADAPASCPSAVAVGGTSLPQQGPETAWTYKFWEGNGGATGGGFSDVFDTPGYQKSLNPSHSGRGLPDVAFDADPNTGYEIVFQGQKTAVGGTSVSGPVFAGIVALANQRRSSGGKQSLANLTQQLYSLHNQINFNDITQGNNNYHGVKGFQAGQGWDACTGWGSMDASQFVSLMAKQ